MSKQSVLASLVALTAAGWVSYEKNKGFQDWLAVAETECNAQYGALPIISKEDSDSFMEPIYATYSGEVPREIFGE